MDSSPWPKALTIPANVIAILKAWLASLDLPQAKILPLTVQQYTGVENHFDIVLSVASINHLDEKACVKLQDSPDAVRTYENIFRGIARMMKLGGKLIITDAARHNVFGDLGIRNPLTPNIEWFKHQQPQYWVELLKQSGFGEPVHSLVKRQDSSLRRSSHAAKKRVLFWTKCFPVGVNAYSISQADCANHLHSMNPIAI